jgi:hypothetical protein
MEEKGTGARVYDRPEKRGKSTLLLLGLVLIVAVVLLFVL